MCRISRMKKQSLEFWNLQFAHAWNLAGGAGGGGKPNWFFWQFKPTIRTNEASDQNVQKLTFSANIPSLIRIGAKNPNLPSESSFEPPSLSLGLFLVQLPVHTPGNRLLCTILARSHHWPGQLWLGFSGANPAQSSGGNPWGRICGIVRGQCWKRSLASNGFGRKFRKAQTRGAWSLCNTVCMTKTKSLDEKNEKFNLSRKRFWEDVVPPLASPSKVTAGIREKVLISEKL